MSDKPNSSTSAGSPRSLFLTVSFLTPNRLNWAQPPIDPPLFRSRIPHGLGEGISRFSPDGGFNARHSRPNYLRQGRLCFLCCLSVCLLATLRNNFQMDLHEIFREGGQWASEQTITFLWRSGSSSIQGLFSAFVTVRRYRKWYQPTALRDAAVPGMH